MHLAPKKLEYYVSLVNGDLVWGNSLPLVPRHYETYYNHSNDNSKDVKVENDENKEANSESIQPIKKSEQKPKVNIVKINESDDKSSIISEITPAHFEALYSPPLAPIKESIIPSTSKKSSEVFKLLSMSPESPYEPWAPFLVSTTSLPILFSEPVHELKVQKSVIRKLEAAPMSMEKKNTMKEDDNKNQNIKEENVENEKISKENDENVEETKAKENDLDKKSSENTVEEIEKPFDKKVTYEEKELEKQSKESKSKCSTKAICAKNNCDGCKDERNTKKRRSNDITIAIKKTKNNGILIEGTAPKACNKEICEIYKNKNFQPESDHNTKKKEERRDQKFTIRAKNNVEIFINNKQIRVANVKNKRSSKEVKKETKGK